MPLGFADPFEALLRLQRAIDAPTREQLEPSISGGGAFPPINVFQRGDDFVVMAELPGLDRQSLTVEAQRTYLRLAGERPAVSAEGSFHRRERAAGAFDRTINLPTPIDSAAAVATYRDGMLTVTLPQSAEVKPHAITVG